MKNFAATAALVAIVPHVMAVTMNTPFNVVECQPQMLSWTGVPPYYLSIIPGGQASAAPLKTFPTQNADSMTWTVDMPAGTSVTFALKDSTGATGFTDVVTIQSGSDKSCMSSSGTAAAPSSDNSGTDASSPSYGAGSTTTPATTATRPVATGTAAITPAAAGTSSRPAVVQAITTSTGSASAASASRSATNGAESHFTAGNIGFAGVVALLGAFLL